MESQRFLAVDPGETVGWSLWCKDICLGGGQTPLGQFPFDVWDAVADNNGPLSEGEEECLRAGITPAQNTGPITLFVIERFALYPWKSKELSFDEMRTSQLIGALKFIASQTGREVHMQSAQIKERAIAAGAEEFFVKPLHENRHQNDSCLHGVWYNLMLKNELQGTQLPKSKVLQRNVSEPLC